MTTMREQVREARRKTEALASEWNGAVAKEAEVCDATALVLGGGDGTPLIAKIFGDGSVILRRDGSSAHSALSDEEADALADWLTEMGFGTHGKKDGAT